jgi:hypothetical protein
VRHDVTSIIEVEGEWLVACACSNLYTARHKSKALADHEQHFHLEAAREALGEDGDGDG